jgi:hypothetical protein
LLQCDLIRSSADFCRDLLFGFCANLRKSCFSRGDKVGFALALLRFIGPPRPLALD